MQQRAITIGAVLCLLAAADSRADGPALGHPQFRPSSARPIGFRGDWTGCYPGANPVTAWDIKRGINVRWRVPTRTFSNAVPLIVGEKLLVNCEPAVLACLDKMTGKLLWARDIGAGATTQTATRPLSLPPQSVVAMEPIAPLWSERKLSYGQWSGMSIATPVCDGQFVWVKSGSMAACFDLDGNRKWVTRTHLIATDHPMNVPSPTLADGVLICEGGVSPYWQQNTRNKIPDGVLPPNRNAKFQHWMVGLDAATGKLLWDLGPLNSGGYGGPASPITVTLGAADASTSYVLTGEGCLIRPRDGKIVNPWVGTRGPFASPVPLAGVGALGVPHRKVSMVELSPAGADRVDATVRWENPRGCGFGGVAIGNGLANTITIEKEARVNVIDLATGQSTFVGLVPQMLTADLNDWPSPAAAGSYVFLFTSHRVAVLEAGRTPKLVAINEVERTHGGPAFDGDRMYLRSYDSIMCIGLTGEEGARYEQQVRAAAPALTALHPTTASRPTTAGGR